MPDFLGQPECVARNSVGFQCTSPSKIFYLSLKMWLEMKELHQFTFTLGQSSVRVVESFPFESRRQAGGGGDSLRFRPCRFHLPPAVTLDPLVPSRPPPESAARRLSRHHASLFDRPNGPFVRLNLKLFAEVGTPRYTMSVCQSGRIEGAATGFRFSHPIWSFWKMNFVLLQRIQHFELKH